MRENKLCKLRELKCVICGNLFYKNICPSSIAKGRGKVCSKSCESKLTSINKKNGEIRTCKNCGKDFYSRPSEDRRGYKRTFCSTQCFTNSPTSDETKTKLSNSLKKVIHRPDWNEKVRLSKIGKKNPMWKYSEDYQGYGDKWGRALKNKIRERDKDTCQVCSSVSKGKQRHPIHHIDFNKKNNSEDNLTVICRGCHKKIHVGKIKFPS
jgi:hypothetical protein